MVLTVTPGDPNANGYADVAYITAYLSGRGVMATLWDAVEDKEFAAARAALMIDVMLSPRRVQDIDRQLTLIYPTWTGAPASATQAMAWPRTGMTNRNGVPILSTVIPIELQSAVAELAGVSAGKDLTLDNATALKGIKTLGVGPINFGFKDNVMTTKVLPDFVTFLLVPSWMTDTDVEFWVRGFDIEAL